MPSCFTIAQQRRIPYRAISFRTRSTSWIKGLWTDRGEMERRTTRNRRNSRNGSESRRNCRPSTKPVTGRYRVSFPSMIKHASEIEAANVGMPPQPSPSSRTSLVIAREMSSLRSRTWEGHSLPSRSWRISRQRSSRSSSACSPSLERRRKGRSRCPAGLRIGRLESRGTRKRLPRTTRA